MDIRQIAYEMLSKKSVKIFLCLFIPMFFVTILSFARNDSRVSTDKKGIEICDEQVLKEEVVDAKEAVIDEEPLVSDVVVDEEVCVKNEKDDETKVEVQDVYSLEEKNYEDGGEKDICSQDIKSYDDDYQQDKTVDYVKSSTVVIVKDRQVDPTRPMVAITFDDGPNEKRTNKILDILEKHNVVATFFELGYLVEKNEKTVLREESLGCEIGNHSYEHKNLDKLTGFSIRKDIKKSEMAFEKILGHKTKLFRAPYGNANSKVRGNVDYPIIKWDIDTLDWKSRDKDKILGKIREVENYDGRIILMHSLYDSTVEAVDVIVPELIEKGYQLVTVSELAYYKGHDVLENGKVYCNFR